MLNFDSGDVDLVILGLCYGIELRTPEGKLLRELPPCDDSGKSIHPDADHKILLLDSLLNPGI